MLEIKRWEIKIYCILCIVYEDDCTILIRELVVIYIEIIQHAHTIMNVWNLKMAFMQDYDVTIPTRELIVSI